MALKENSAGVNPNMLFTKSISNIPPGVVHTRLPCQALCALCVFLVQGQCLRISEGLITIQNTCGGKSSFIFFPKSKHRFVQSSPFKETLL